MTVSEFVISIANTAWVNMQDIATVMYDKFGLGMFFFSSGQISSLFYIFF